MIAFGMIEIINFNENINIVYQIHKIMSLFKTYAVCKPILVLGKQPEALLNFLRI